MPRNDGSFLGQEYEYDAPKSYHRIEQPCEKSTVSFYMSKIKDLSEQINWALRFRSNPGTPDIIELSARLNAYINLLEEKLSGAR